MPSCSDCQMLEGDKCKAHLEALRTLGRDLPPPPTGACMLPIVEGYLDSISKGMHVLDIGCGSWDAIKRHCEAVGAKYEGIDTQASYYGKPSVATRIENLAQLSFEENTFDLVIGNQTMEHWGENGCSIEWGLYQCFRVCRPHGKVFLNVPIHFHGTKEFLLGDLKSLKRIFAKFSSDVEWESWGNPSTPLPDFYPFPQYWPLKNKPAYILDIRATKNKPLPRKINTSKNYTGRLAQIHHYPFSFNLFRVYLKLSHYFH